jgi:hypothetical protein
MLPLSSGPFTISVSLAVKLRRLCACVIEQCYSEFEPIAFTSQTDRICVTDELQRLWNESVVTSFKLQGTYFI